MPRMRSWFAWLHNHTDHRDDEPIRVEARTYKEAEEAVRQVMNTYPYTNRFSLGWVKTAAEFKKFDSWWYEQLRRKKPCSAK